MDRRRFSIPWVYARTLSAALLLFAAFTKLGSAEPTAETMILGGRWIKAFVIQVEILLAVWLLSGVYGIAARRTAIALFVAFAAYSAYLVWQGIPSCGCFGALDTSPIFVLCLDIFLVTTLTFSIPPSDDDSERLPGHLVGMTLLMLMVGGALGWLLLSNEVAVFGFTGKPLSVGSEIVNFGNNSTHNSFSKSVDIVNNTQQIVSLVGCSAKCSCLVGVDFPLQLPPGKSISIPLTFPAGVRAGEFSFPIRFFTDHPKLTALSITCVGYVTQ